MFELFLGNHCESLRYSAEIAPRRRPRPATLPSYNLTILRSYNLTVLQSYNLTILQSSNLTILQSYNLTIGLSDVQSCDLIIPIVRDYHFVILLSCKIERL